MYFMKVLPYIGLEHSKELRLCLHSAYSDVKCCCNINIVILFIYLILRQVGFEDANRNFNHEHVSTYVF